TIRIEAPIPNEFIVWRGPRDGLHFKRSVEDRFLLAAIHDGSGTARQLRYATECRFTEIRDHGGRALELRYQNDRVAQVLERSCQDASRARRVMEYRYDQHGCLATALDATGAAMSYRYDNGYLVQETDASGFSFFFEYDSDGRCIRTWGDGGLLLRRFDYDLALGITRVIDSLGGSRFYYHTGGYVDR